VVLLCIVGVWIGISCIQSRRLKQVKEPRSGRVMGQRVALVFSKHYQVNMAGFENLHTFDVHKYAKIYLRLIDDGVIRAEDVFVPAPVTREQILTVHTHAFLRSLKA